MRSEKGGCGGGLILAAVVALVVIVAAALLVGKLAEYNDAEASRLYARGALEESYARAQGEIIRAEGQARADMVVAQSQARLDQAVAEAQMSLAQGQARLDSAQAFAVTAGASLPWLTVAVVGVAGIVLLAAIVAMLALGLAAMRSRPTNWPTLACGPVWVLPGLGRVAVLPAPANQARESVILPQLEEPAAIAVYREING
jgi:hypothetical protein